MNGSDGFHKKQEMKCLQLIMFRKIMSAIERQLYGPDDEEDYDHLA